MRKTSIENNLQILKVEYHTNNWSDLLQIVKSSSEDQLKIKKLYINNHWSDLTPILSLSSEDQTKIKNSPA